jgi:hypothetical protein
VCVERFLVIKLCDERSGDFLLCYMLLDEKTALLFLNVDFGLGGCFPYN